MPEMIRCMNHLDIHRMLLKTIKGDSDIEVTATLLISKPDYSSVSAFLSFFAIFSGRI